MDGDNLIDTSFDVRTDASGKDPDAHSKTLRRYHRWLWSKPLPSGAVWRLSINQSRGIHPRIRDRFDLTLECIRRHYEGSESPLAATLAWYDDFFRLFEDFRGYVDHFLLSDLVDSDYGSVRFVKEFDGFQGNPLPATSVAEYREYMKRSMDFIRARNSRIAHYAASELHN